MRYIAFTCKFYLPYKVTKVEVVLKLQGAIIESLFKTLVPKDKQ